MVARNRKSGASKENRARADNKSPSEKGSNKSVAGGTNGNAKTKAGKKAEAGSGSMSAGDSDEVAQQHAQHSKHGHEHHKKKSRFRKWLKTKRFMFIVGALLGVVIAGYSAKQNDLVSMELLSDLSIDSMLDDFRDMLPLSVLKEAKNLENDQSIMSESFAVGNALRAQNLTAKYPVVLIPGVISTGLESWGLEGTPECPSQQYFRKRLWGSWHMLRSMFLDKPCWLKHIMLDTETGLDPPHFKLRAAQGMEAADFFITGYWIWNKIIENMAALGYDINTMAVAAYDWRLAYLDLERRDSYFSKLKAMIEQKKALTGEKTVLVGHSMGSQVIFYFMKWVEAEGFGNGGSSWVNDHIASMVDISGSILGTPKAIVALLSGEMKDTVQLNALAVYGLEKFFSRRERADMLRSFGGIASMLPKGGEALWGTLDSAPDDPVNKTDGVSYGSFIKFKRDVGIYSNKNLTVSESIDYLFEQSPQWFNDRVKTQYSNGLARTEAEVKANEKDFSKWINPLEVALPNAPDMKIFCFYGVGKETERSYYYEQVSDVEAVKLNATIDSSTPDAVITGQGDGTISLLTHTMCHKWKEPGSRFNPGGIPVTIVEMLHQPDIFDLRGGAKTAEHVDILGRTELNEMVLRVAAGAGDTIEDHYESSLKDWVKNLDLD